MTSLGRRLLVQHGERVTRHEIVDRAIIIGRDPGCDLFFADRKLSRRHARLEPGPWGVALVDMGSRNGCWVNERRVEESQILVSGDGIRMGGLQITFEEDPPTFRDSTQTAESTVVFGSMGAAPESWQTPAGSTLRKGGDDTVLFSEPLPGKVDHPVGGLAEVPLADEAGTVAFLGDEADRQARDIPAILLGPKENMLGVSLAVVLTGIAFCAYLVGVVVGLHAAERGGILVFIGLVLIAVMVGAAVFLLRKITLGHGRRLRWSGEAGVPSEPTVSLAGESPAEEVEPTEEVDLSEPAPASPPTRDSGSPRGHEES